MAISQSSRQWWPERAVALPILLALALLAALAWAAAFWQAGAGGVLMNAGVPMSPDMGGRIGLASALIFLALWLAMMAAMMFPSVWPVVLLYAALLCRRGGRGGSVPLFVAGYLAVWETFGLIAYATYVGSGLFLDSHGEVARRLSLLTGIVVILAGLYQFTPLKRMCLAHCQTPLAYLAAHWRDGRPGALRMGAVHGAYCLGCCSGLMLALLAIGVMDLRWMVTVSAVIAVEKLGPRHRALPAAVGIGLVLLGIAVALWPQPGAASGVVLGG